MRYLVVIEEGPTSFGAYVPDLPGCIAAGESREEVLQIIQEAIDFHRAEIKENGHRFPQPHASRAFVDIHACSDG